jgi:hypothetical protein
MSSIFVNDEMVLSLTCKWCKSPPPIGLGCSLPKMKTLKYDIIYNNDLLRDMDNTYNEAVAKLAEFLSRVSPTDTIGIGAWSSQYPLWYPKNAAVRAVQITREFNISHAGVAQSIPRDATRRQTTS